MKDINDNKTNGFFGKIKASFSGRKFRSGAYVTAISTVVIVIVLVLNMLVTKMNIQVDLSSQGMYTLTEDTKGLIKDIKDDITIYYMVQSGNEYDIYTNIIKQYDAASDHITVVNKDPILYPQFASNFVADEIATNSFIVVDNTNGIAKYISPDELIIQEMNYQTYQSEMTGVDVEGQLTSAIQYVTSGDLPKLYVVEGHGETEAGESFSTSMDKMNVEVATLSTLSESSIPEDCDFLFINSPTADFSDAETTMIMDYMEAGGKAIITLDYFAEELTNFRSILEYYGIEMVNGRVLENDANYRSSEGMNVLLPSIEMHDITTLASSNDIPVVMLDASGLLVSDTLRSTLTVEPLLTTSDSSYSQLDTQSSNGEKQAGDIDGPFNLGLVSTDTYNGITSSIVVYSSAITFIEDTATYGNGDLLTGTVGYLIGDSDLLSIPTKSTLDTYIYPTQNQAYTVGVITIIIIPITLIIVGGVICYRRRKQ